MGRRPAGTQPSTTAQGRSPWIALVSKLFLATDVSLCQIKITNFVLLASPASGKMGPAGSVTESPKPLNLVPKQERTSGTGGILNLNLGQYHRSGFV